MHNISASEASGTPASHPRGKAPRHPSGQLYRTTVSITWDQREYCQGNSVNISSLLRSAIAAKMEVGGRVRIQRELEEAEGRVQMLRLALDGLDQQESKEAVVNRKEEAWRASVLEFAEAFWGAVVTLPGGRRGHRDELPDADRANLNWAKGWVKRHPACKGHSGEELLRLTLELRPVTKEAVT